MSSETVKIVRFHQTGDASVLQLEELENHLPQGDEVRIKVEAIGLNRAEIMFRNGQYLEAPEFPSRLGYEAAGVVDAIGPDVQSIAVGDRVSTIPAYSLGRYGVYGESAIVPAGAVAHYPKVLSAAEGTAIWMQYITAYGALVEYGNIGADDRVLITAASSSVGVAAMQIAKMRGAEAIAVTRTAEKVEFLKAAGADHVVVSNDEDLAERVMTITGGKGASLVFDPIGGPQLAQLADAAAPGATIYEYGALSPEETPFPLFAAIGKALTIRGYTLFEITRDAEKRERAKSFVTQGIEAGHLKPLIAKTFALADIVAAHRYMESNQQCGKVVVLV